MGTDPVRILLVEDNAGDALLFTELLSECPGAYEVKRTDRLSSALELMAREPFDLIFMDLGLPDGGGIDAVQRVRVRTVAPVVVLTGAYSEEITAAALAAGVTTFLVKGAVTPEEIHAAIVKHLDRTGGGGGL